MFKDCYFYELGYWLRKPVTYIYFVTFFAFAFLVFIGSAGFFDSPPAASTKTIRLMNSPYEINYTLLYFTKFFLFLLPAIVGVSIYKDYKYRMHSILYTFPIKKSSYLLAKFLSTYTIVAFISLSAGLAFYLGEHMPGLHSVKLGQIAPLGYLQAYAMYVLPTLFFVGLLVFSVVAYTRNIYAGFMLVIVVFLFQLIVENWLGGMGWVDALSVLDPFAQHTKEYAIQSWTVLDTNTKLIPISKVVVFNRLFWLAFALLSFSAMYRKFAFHEDSPGFRFRKPKKEPLTRDKISIPINFRLADLEYDFSWKQQLKVLWKLSRIELAYISRSWMFLVLLFFGILAVLFAIAKVTNFEEIALLPVTKVVLTIPALFFTMIMTLTTFLYSGMLVQRAKTTRMNALIDVTPVPNWVLLFSKVTALLQMQLILLFVLMLAGIVIQLVNGYYNFEIGLYLFQLYVLTFPLLLIWSFVSIFIQTLFTNTYLGLFVLIIGWLGFSGLPQLGITSKLILFNTPPKTTYSDMNGYGETLAPYFLVVAYWLLFALFFLMLAQLLWVRGVPQSFKERLQLAKKRLKKPLILGMVCCLIGFLILGFSIHSAEKEKGWAALSSTDRNNVFAKFKEKFQKYENRDQPRITSMKVQLDIFPEMNSFLAKGSYVLVNKWDRPLDTLLVKTGFDEHTTFQIASSYKIVEQDSIMKFTVLKLNQTIAPGDSIRFGFEVRNKTNTLFERNSNVLRNGTFLLNDLFPRLGYSFGEDSKHPTDSTAVRNHIGAVDADLIHFEATVSTSKDQIAIAPGYLEKQWVTGNRNYYHYKTTAPIKYILGINSGRFHSKKEDYKGVGLEVYHHPGHTYNLTEMMNGLKAALDYNTKHFAPYQHKQARIIEFPDSEGSFATTMANSIPMSEIRFIANTDTADNKVDLAFYVTAHELTHQWWGNQLVGADAKGSRMLSESITEYITLDIYRQQYGEEVADQFLEQQRNRYFRGRRNADEKEPPLLLVGEQKHLFYGKGAMVFNTLGHHLGRDTLNSILKDFLCDYRLQSKPPYPTSISLVERLKSRAPDSLQYLTKDLFEAVTFYDSKIKKTTLKKTTDGRYELDVDFEVRKYIDDRPEESLPLADFVEIGVYDQEGTLLHIENQKVIQENNNISILLNKKPMKVQLDPGLYCIDKNIEDNEQIIGN